MYVGPPKTAAVLATTVEFLLLFGKHLGTGASLLDGLALEILILATWAAQATDDACRGLELHRMIVELFAGSEAAAASADRIAELEGRC